MKGLVLAGGSGTRLRPLTHGGAKQLVPVANRPILFYALDTLVEAEILDIGVVLSPETGAEVRAAVGDGSAWGARVDYIVQDRPGGLAHALMTARAFVGDDDTCMFLGDNLIGMSLRETLASFAREPGCAASVLLKEVVDPRRFGVAELDAQGRLIGLVEKPMVPRSNLALVGIYLFRSVIFDAIGEITPSPRGELEITDAISRLLVRGERVRCERIDSWWLDTGKKDDLLHANAIILEDRLVHDVRGAVDEESRVSGRVRLEEGATVVRSTIRGPVAIGRGARIVDASIGPLTSIGDDVVIERSGVARSVVLAGGRIVDVPRLVDSVIGRRVVVQRGAGISLLVGDDCSIEL
jgi:glucose-1-phosphate thymidylyltransferase